MNRGMSRETEHSSGLHYRRANVVPPSRKRRASRRRSARVAAYGARLPSKPADYTVPVKIVIADDLPRSAVDLLAAEGWTVDAVAGRPLDQLTRDLSDADALVVRSATKVTAPLISAASRLRVIARAGTGVDNVDVGAASARGIVVMNAPGANSTSVAELAVGLMLALARNVAAADAAMKQGKWEKKRFMGEELR